MKKFFMIAVMAVAALTASAQSNSCQEVGTIGIKPYVGLSSGMMLSNDENTDMRLGFTIGAEAQYMVNDWFAVSAGLAYAQQGGADELKGIFDDGKTGDFTYQFDYINIPVLANFYVCKGLALKVGLQPGFAVNQKIKFSADGISASGSIADSFRKFDLAIPVGISYEVKNIVFDARVNCGTLGVFDDEDALDADNYTNGVFQLTVGYRF